MEAENKLTTKLSICIPTYNRENLLKNLIDSIVNEANPKMVQIVISDNASTDGTKEMVGEYLKKYENITYHRHEKNLGADINYLKAVELASGDYCWLMGSDDAIVEGSVNKLLRYLSDDFDIYLTSRVECDFKLNPINIRSWIEGNQEFEVFKFNKKEVISLYFERCTSLGGVFSYLSSIIVKKTSWNKIKFNEIFIGTAYSHASILINMVMKGCSLGIIKEPLVYSRSGNDSFLINWVQRSILDLEGYGLIADIFIEDSSMRNEFNKVMRKEYPVIKLIKTKILYNSNDWKKLEILCTKNFGFKKWVFILISVCYPLGLLYIKLKKLIVNNIFHKI